MKTGLKKTILLSALFLIGTWNINPTFAQGTAERLKGRILLQVQSSGQAWYVNPVNSQRIFLGRPNDAFRIMRELGLGITNANLEKIPVATDIVSGADSDNDGLPDAMEDSLGTKKSSNDSDNDGYGDKNEIENGYNPAGPGKIQLSTVLLNEHKGKIFIQVQKNGEAWYLSPTNGKRYFLGRPNDAFNIMRGLGLGISENDINKILAVENQSLNKEPSSGVKEANPANETIESTSNTGNSSNQESSSDIKEPSSENEAAKNPPNQNQEAQTSGAAWQQIEKMSDSGAASPSLSFSENGDLWLFYSKKDGSLYSRQRPFSKNFGAEKKIIEKGQEASPLFRNGNLAMLSVSSKDYTEVYSSEDGGGSWNREKYYLATNNQAMSKHLFSSLAEKNGDLTLVFGFNHNSGVFGVSPKIMIAKKTSGTWDSSAIQIGNGEPNFVSLAGNETIIFSTYEVLSNLSGNWTKKNNPGDIYENIAANDAFKDGNDIYIAREYSYGQNINDKNIGFYKSSDNGSSWTALKSIHSQSDHIRGTEVAAKGKTILVAWYSYSSRGSIDGKLSFDGGETWGEKFNILTLPDGKKIPDNITGRNTYIKAAGWNGGLAVAAIDEDGTIYLREYK